MSRLVNIAPDGGPDRECGGCTVCCTTHGVERIGKPQHTPCMWCEEGVGCKIFRLTWLPRVCRSFRCAWHQGLWGEEQRPDRCGVVAELHKGRLFHVWLIREVEPGARHTKEGKRVMDAMSMTNYPVVLMTPDGAEVLTEGERSDIMRQDVEAYRGRHVH